jgi:hypothetical protein
MPLKASTVRHQATATLEDLPGWANTAIGVRTESFRRVTACDDESRLDLRGQCLIMSWRRFTPSSTNE